MEGTGDAKRSSEVTPVVAHVATRLTLEHRFTGMRVGRKVARHNDTALHWSPSFIPDAMLSEVESHQ